MARTTEARFEDREDLDFAPHETRELQWQVVRERFERAQRRKFTRQIWHDKLVDLLWMGKILEAMRTKVAQRCLRRQLALR